MIELKQAKKKSKSCCEIEVIKDSVALRW